MVTGAVLPPATSWGFDLRQEPASAHGSPAASPLRATPHTPLNNSNNMTPTHAGTKRKHPVYPADDSDGEMDEDSDDSTRRIASASINNNNNNSTTSNMSTPRHFASTHQHQHQHNNHHHHSQAKRARMMTSTFGNDAPGQTLPPHRLLESLDLKGLQQLVTSLCERHPDLFPEVVAMAPRVTVATAVDVLRTKLAAVKDNMPYKSDPEGDYAYLRVKPYLNEFHSALEDYVRHFLPPGESQPSNTLAFLDEATCLVHALPSWSNPLNSHQRYAAYDDLAQAWAMAIKEAVKRPAGALALAQGQWEQRIARHNESAGNRLKVAVNTINQELSWVNGTPSAPLSPAHASSPMRSSTPQLWC